MNFEEYKRQAEHHNKSGNLAEALFYYRKIEEIAPDDWENHIALADTLTVSQDWEQAALSYRNALALKHNFDWAHYNLAAALIRMGNTLEADESFAQLEDINPNFEQSHRDKPQVQRNFGDHYFRSEAWDKAITAYQRVIHIHPDAYSEHLNIARALSYSDKLQAAIPFFKKAADLQPDSVWPTYYLAEFYFKTKQYELAKQGCSEAICKDKRFPWAYHLKGKIQYKTHHWQAALQSFEQAVLIKSGLIDAHQSIGEIYLRLNQWNEAIQKFRQIIKSEPNSYFAYCGLADALSRTGEIDSAITSYQKALDIQPCSPNITQKLKDLRQLKENLPKAPIGKSLSSKRSEKTESASSEVSQHHQRVASAKAAVFSFTAPDFAAYDRNHRALRIAIKISAPDLREGCQWGDFHYANSLMKAFSRQGHQARVDCQDAWYTNLGKKDDLVIVLRGRHFYEVQPHQLNFLWMISHPDRPTDEELNGYDHVFVASYEYAQKVSARLSTCVSCMYQCTDAGIFYPPEQPEAPFAEVLFVGSSRNIFRPVVKSAVELDVGLSVYGPLWEQFIPDSIIKGEYVQNNQLNHYYNQSSVLLNDHWDTMRDEGFLSNRLFDASASEAFVITDAVTGIERVFGDAIETYRSPEELKQKITHYTNNVQLGRQKAGRAREIVLGAHTFNHRADTFIATAEEILRSDLRQADSRYATDRLSLSQHDIDLSSIYSQAITSQMQWFHDNVTPIEHGIRRTGAARSAVFYEWMWRINWQDPSYQEFLLDFAASERRLLDTFSETTVSERLSPLVSIIMPTFNRAYVIADGIQSVLDQTYQNWELLICDDGSTDNTEGVIGQFEDNRIRYFKLPKGNGPVARNFGLKYASGDYIAYLDSDNIWHPQHLCLCISILLKNTYAMSCYTGYADVELVKTEIDLLNLSYAEFEYYKLLNRNFIDLNGLVHRRELFEWLGGFDTTLPRLQDWDLALRYTYLFEPIVVKNYTVFYRRNIAWSQVTKLFSGLDIRSIVQAKALDVLSQGATNLKQDRPLRCRVSVLVDAEQWEEFSKAVAIAKALSKYVDTQLIIVGGKAAEESLEIPALRDLDHITIIRLDAIAAKEVLNSQPVDDLRRQITREAWFNQLAITTSDRLVVVSNPSIFWIKVALLLRDIHKRSVLACERAYQHLISQGAAASDDWRNRPPLLIEEVRSVGEPNSAMICGPTIINKASILAVAEDSAGKVDLGFSKKDFIIVFWDRKTAYSERDLIEFRRQFDSDRCKVVWACSSTTVSAVQDFDFQPVTDGILRIEIGSEQQAVKLLKGADVCVLWEASSSSKNDVGHSFKDSPEIPLAFVYSLISGCIPILTTAPEFEMWSSYNYSRSVLSKDWEALIETCQKLHQNPRKTAKLKKNGRKLYNIRFSQAVTAERLKPLLFKINQPTKSAETPADSALDSFESVDVTWSYSLEAASST